MEMDSYPHIFLISITQNSWFYKLIRTFLALQNNLFPIQRNLANIGVTSLHKTVCINSNFLSITKCHSFVQLNKQEETERKKETWNDLFGYTKYFKGKQRSMALSVYCVVYILEFQSQPEYIQ